MKGTARLEARISALSIRVNLAKKTGKSRFSKGGWEKNVPFLRLGNGNSLRQGSLEGILPRHLAGFSRKKAREGKGLGVSALRGPAGIGEREKMGSLGLRGDSRPHQSVPKLGETKRRSKGGKDSKNRWGHILQRENRGIFTWKKHSIKRKVLRGEFMVGSMCTRAQRG